MTVHHLSAFVDEIDHALTPIEIARGAIGRDLDDEALVFEYGEVGKRSIHMVGIREPMDVLWLRDGEVVRRKTLAPWTGLASAEADTVVEMPAGAAPVDAGDVVHVPEPERHGWADPGEFHPLSGGFVAMMLAFAVSALVKAGVAMATGLDKCPVQVRGFYSTSSNPAVVGCDPALNPGLLDTVSGFVFVLVWVAFCFYLCRSPFPEDTPRSK